MNKNLLFEVPFFKFSPNLSPQGGVILKNIHPWIANTHTISALLSIPCPFDKMLCAIVWYIIVGNTALTRLVTTLTEWLVILQGQLLYSFIHSFIHLFIYSSFHSFIYPSIHLFILPFIYSSFNSFIHPSIHLFIIQFIYSSFNSFIHPSIHLFILPFIYLSFHSFIHPSIHLFILPFIHLSFHSFILSFILSSFHSLMMLLKKTIVKYKDHQIID